jgi:tRNA pseudouridine38-40 synthase
LSRNEQITEPFIVNDTEYISVTFIGQSFMLHQIVRPQSSFFLG